jgi:multidrug efflux pump subunit AcrB
MMAEDIGWAERLRSLAASALGLILSFVPLALWIAWTGELLLMVVVTGVVSAALLVLLSRLQDPADEARWALRQHGAARETLTDESMAQLHRLFPLTYHHGRRNSSRFRSTMAEFTRRLAKPAARAPEN